MNDSCSEQMVREHTATLTSHEEQLKAMAHAQAAIIESVHRLERTLLGNGSPSLGEQITRSIARLGSAIGERMATVEHSVKGAHRRLDRLQSSQWWLVGFILMTAASLFIGGKL